MQPQAFALGGGKDGLIDSFYRYPHTQITEVFTISGESGAGSAVVDYWVVLQNWRSENLSEKKLTMQLLQRFSAYIEPDGEQ